MLVYNYKNTKIRCFEEDGIYYFALTDIRKLYPVSRAYVSRIGKEVGAFVHRVKGDTRDILYLSSNAFNGVLCSSDSFANFFIEMVSSFDENNLEEIVGNFGKKKLNDYNIVVNIDKLLKKVIVKIVGDTYYFNLAYLGQELGMSSDWSNKRAISAKLKNIVSYEDLVKFFSIKLHTKNPYVITFRNFCLENKKFDMVKLRSSFRALEKRLK